MKRAKRMAASRARVMARRRYWTRWLYTHRVGLEWFRERMLRWPPTLPSIGGPLKWVGPRYSWVDPLKGGEMLPLLSDEDCARAQEMR